MFKDIDEALGWLYVQKKNKKREDLSRIKTCVSLLNLNPSYEVIHIAGTNGKGSTASFIKKMLELKGYRVGFFISPFVISFNERIQINSEYVSDEKIIYYLNQLYEFSKKYTLEYDDTIPFFELTFLMSLMHFKANEIDYLVLECGLGGRLDATNIFDNTLPVITNVGLDHLNQLGETLEDIAWHKLGIVRSNKPCFTCVDNEIKYYFMDYALKNNLDIRYVFNDVSSIKFRNNLITFKYLNREYKTTLNAKYQAYNASLAIAVIKYLFKDYSEDLITKALLETSWPGRFEEVRKDVIIDGAHNIPGILALVESLKSKYADVKYKIVFTALHDKKIAEMLNILDEIASYYYFTTIIDSRATDINYFKDYTSKEYSLFNDYTAAIFQALAEKKDNEILVITGSLHFISDVRKLFK